MQDEPAPGTATSRLAAIDAAFGHLRELGFSSTDDPSRVSTTFERDFVSLVVQVVVAAPTPDEGMVALRWPDQAFAGAPIPTVTLDDLASMLGAFVPADPVDESADPLARGASRLHALARDALHGSLSILVDAMIWHWASGEAPPPGAWWGVPPYSDKEMRGGEPRSRDDVLRDLDFCDLKIRWRADRDGAWPLIQSFVGANPMTSQAEWLLEDVILEGDDPLVDAVIDTARHDPAFAETVRAMHLGGFAGPAIERIEALQAELEA